MSRSIRCLVALLLAFALALNAVGAVPARSSVGGCCGGTREAPTATAGPPCHVESTASLSCTVADAGKEGAPALAAAHDCGDGCAHCLSHQGGTQAIVVPACTAQDLPIGCGEVPRHRAGDLPPPRPERLERPPARVPLD